MLSASSAAASLPCWMPVSCSGVGGEHGHPPCCLGDVLGRAPYATGRSVLKVQASTWWVTPAAAMAPNLSLPPRRCCLPAGAKRSGDPLWRDGERRGNEPAQHRQLSRASVLSHRGVHTAELCLEGPSRRGMALGRGCWAGGGGWPPALAPCHLALGSRPPHTHPLPMPCLGTHEGCHPVLAQV